MNLLQRVIRTRAGGRVNRYHVTQHSPYNVAEHSWGVAVLLYHLWPDDFPRLAIHALIDDVPEAWTGDIPHPIKHRLLRDLLRPLESSLLQRLQLPAKTKISTSEQLKLRICDWLEFYIWCLEELARGNLFVREGLAEIICALDNIELLPPADELYQALGQGSYELVVPNKIHWEGLLPARKGPDSTGMTHPFGFLEDEDI